jgi:excinuclease ABC subunit C
MPQALALPVADLDRLRRQVAATAKDTPGVYRMLDASGRVIYVGKAKRLRPRILSYFRARYPDDKAARILHSATQIEWDYAPSEFAALLGELRHIRRYRPLFNLRMNRDRRACFVRVSAGPAPKLVFSRAPGPAHREPRSPGDRYYGPYHSGMRLTEAIRVLNDFLGLRDCALDMRIVFAGQADLFSAAPRALCIRHELGTCAGPCAGLVSEDDYQVRAAAAVAFLENRSAHPLDRLIAEMQAASESAEFERAIRLREKYDTLEWLFGATVRSRAALEGLSFVYRDRGVKGDDRSYVIVHGTVRAGAPSPATPLEREAFRGLVDEHRPAAPAPPGPLPLADLDEILLVMSWFRKHPEAYGDTTPFENWVRASA